MHTTTSNQIITDSYKLQSGCWSFRYTEHTQKWVDVASPLANTLNPPVWLVYRLACTVWAVCTLEVLYKKHFISGYTVVNHLQKLSVNREDLYHNLTLKLFYLLSFLAQRKSDVCSHTCQETPLSRTFNTENSLQINASILKDQNSDQKLWGSTLTLPQNLTHTSIKNQKSIDSMRCTHFLIFQKKHILRLVVLILRLVVPSSGLEKTQVLGYVCGNLSLALSSDLSKAFPLLKSRLDTEYLVGDRVMEKSRVTVNYFIPLLRRSITQSYTNPDPVIKYFGSYSKIIFGKDELRLKYEKPF